MLVAGTVPELPGDGKPVLPVSFLSLGVARGRRPVEEGYLAGPVLNTLSEYVDDAPAGDLPFQAVEEPSSGGGPGAQVQCGRCFRLGGLEECRQVFEVDAVGAFVVLRVAGEPPVAGQGVGDQGLQALLGRVGDHARSCGKLLSGSLRLSSQQPCGRSTGRSSSTVSVLPSVRRAVIPPGRCGRLRCSWL